MTISKLIAVGITLLICALSLCFSPRVAGSQSLITPAYASTTPKMAPSCPSKLSNEQCAIRSRILAEFSDVDGFDRVIECESHFRQFDASGEVLRSDTDDVGATQINLHYWLDESKKLGYDIYTLDGNLKMARVVYERQGVEAWTCSKVL